MNELKKSSGKCLCGSVTIKVSSMKNGYGACHCSMCRKWGGGPLLAVDCGSDVTFTNEESISVHNTSDWAERGFCSKCGTHLFYRIKETKQCHIPVGLLDEAENLPFVSQVFIDEKPENYSFSNETQDLTGKQIFEMYAPKE